jgi:amidase
LNRIRTKCTVEDSHAFVQRIAIEPQGSGPLDGLEFAVKDLMDLAGCKTSCGNPRWLATHPVAVANAVCVDQLLFAGGRCVGKTVTDELAFGLDGENFFYGTPLNPRAPDRVPGGSSSGSASAVACGLADFALGTDTGGSVRVPASNCGILGMRPSHGFISVAGVNPLAPSFDTVGVLARDLDVLKKAASVLLACQVPAQVEVARVHFLADAFAAADREVTEALSESVEFIKSVFPGKARETSLTDLGFPEPENGLRGWYETYARIQWAEIRSCLGAWVEDAQPEFGPRPRVNFQLVRQMDRSLISEAIQRREACFRHASTFLGPHELLCMPTTPTLAPRKGSLGFDRTVETYFPRTLAFTAIAGICRLPQVTMPIADVGGVPVGLSLLAPHGMDAFLLAASGMLDS